MTGFDIPWGLEDEYVGAHSKVPYLPFYVDGYKPIILDEEDYLWARQWRWQWNPSKNKKKLYVRRTATYQGRYISVYMHKVICLRANGPPPSPCHIISDHMNGNELDCRRVNLRWATPSDNRQNYHGIYAQQVRMDYLTRGTRLLRSHVFGGLRGTEWVPPRVPTEVMVCAEAPF